MALLSALTGCFTITGATIGLVVPRYETLSLPTAPAPPSEWESATTMATARAEALAGHCYRTRRILKDLAKRDPKYVTGALVFDEDIHRCDRLERRQQVGSYAGSGAQIGLVLDLVVVLLCVSAGCAVAPAN